MFQNVITALWEKLKDYVLGDILQILEKMYVALLQRTCLGALNFNEISGRAQSHTLEGPLSWKVSCPDVPGLQPILHLKDPVYTCIALYIYFTRIDACKGRTKIIAGDANVI